MNENQKILKCLKIKKLKSLKTKITCKMKFKTLQNQSYSTSYVSLFLPSISS